jgi:hypothetical protein
MARTVRPGAAYASSDVPPKPGAKNPRISIADGPLPLSHLSTVKDQVPTETGLMGVATTMHLAAFAASAGPAIRIGCPFTAGGDPASETEHTAETRPMNTSLTKYSPLTSDARLAEGRRLCADLLDTRSTLVNVTTSRAMFSF